MKLSEAILLLETALRQEGDKAIRFYDFNGDQIQPNGVHTISISGGDGKGRREELQLAEIPTDGQADCETASLRVTCTYA